MGNKAIIIFGYKADLSLLVIDCHSTGIVGVVLFWLKRKGGAYLEFAEAIHPFVIGKTSHIERGKVSSDFHNIKNICLTFIQTKFETGEETNPP